MKKPAGFIVNRRRGDPSFHVYSLSQPFKLATAREFAWLETK